MNKLVVGVFKAIMISMILVFVFDMVGYLYKAMVLDQRMKNLMANMQRTVAENNCLPEGAYLSYSTMMKQIATSLNGNDANSFVGTRDKGSTALFLNYKDNAVGIPDDVKTTLASAGGGVLHTNMKEVGRYGEIMVVQAAVCVRQPTWNFISNDGTNQRNMANWESSEMKDSPLKANTTVFTYTYYVPLMKYSKYKEP